MEKRNKVITAGIVCALLAALLSSFYVPVSSLLLSKGAAPMILGGFDYLGGGVAAAVFFLINFLRKKHNPALKADPYLKGKDWLILSGQIVCTCGSTISVMFAIKNSSASSVSLLSNFELLCTSLIALIFFKEIIHVRSWIGIILIASGCILLTLDFRNGVSFSWASLLAFAACLFWGIDNNLGRLLSMKNKEEAITIKALSSGTIMVVMAFITGERIESSAVFFGLLLGVVSIGLSLLFYMRGQEVLGAAKTSAFYALSPFLGSILSILILQEVPLWSFYISLGVVLFGQSQVVIDLFKQQKLINSAKPKP